MPSAFAAGPTGIQGKDLSLALRGEPLPGVCAVVTTDAGDLSPDKARFIDLVECGGRGRPSVQLRISAFVDGHTIRLEDVTGPDCEDEHVFLVQQNGENRIVRVDRPDTGHEAQPGNPAVAEVYRRAPDGTTLDVVRTIPLAGAVCTAADMQKALLATPPWW